MENKNQISETELRSEHKRANELAADIIDLIRGRGAHESSFALATASALVLLGSGLEFERYCGLVKDLMKDFETYEKENSFFN